MPSARSKARKRAVDVLYAADLRGIDPLTVLADAQARPVTHDTPAFPPYAADLVRGVTEHRTEIDRVLRDLAEGWTLERMPAVDRNILRVGVQELLHVEGVPRGVAVSEAVERAAELSTNDSPRFVNGLLSRIAQGREGGGSGLGRNGPPRVGGEDTPVDELIGEGDG